MTTLKFTVALLCILTFAVTANASDENAQPPDTALGPSFWMVKLGVHSAGDLYSDTDITPDPHADFSLGVAFCTPVSHRLRIGGFADWHRLRPDVPFTVFGVNLAFETGVKVGKMHFLPGFGVASGFFGGGGEDSETHFQIGAQLISFPTQELGWLLELQVSLIGEDKHPYGLRGGTDNLVTFRGGVAF